MVDPAAALFVFHCSLMVYVVPELRAWTAWTNAAFGENVPANPPLSFQATTVPLTVIAMSWLNPALAVKRSELPPMTAVLFADGVTVTLRLVLSMSIQVAPSLFVSVYWWVLTAEATVVVTSCAVSRVGEKVGLLPAPAEMVAPAAALFVFQRSLIV